LPGLTDHTIDQIARDIIVLSAGSTPEQAAARTRPSRVPAEASDADSVEHLAREFMAMDTGLVVTTADASGRGSPRPACLRNFSKPRLRK
jgi:hypothetical protein